MSMRIFVTGATGFIGAATVRELLSAGHQVVGLVRSDANAAALSALGGTVLRGSIEELDVLRRGAEGADGVIHTAFLHDGFANFANSCAVDQRAIIAIGEVLAGSNRPFAVTSGTPVVTGRASTEHDVGERKNPIAALRGPSEEAALAFVERGVRAMLMRMPRAVHGLGEHGWRGGLAGQLVDLARQKGVAAYIEDGATRWPAVHRLDTARLYRLAIEKAPSGTRVHAVAEEGVTMRDLATAIGTKLGVPVASKSREEAPAHFGAFGMLAASDQPATSAHTRELLGWQPTRPGLLADFEANG